MDVDVYFANECIYTEMAQSFAFVLSFLMETLTIFFFLVRRSSFIDIYSDTESKVHYCNWL